MTLTADRFPEFFRQAHGYDPFPWQQELIARVLAQGQWPGVVDVETGLGKTFLIDAAVFVAAARHGLGRRRVFFVVDRRLVVDQAFEHALTLQTALTRATAGACAEVAAALRNPGDDGDAVQVTRMRGGLTWSWRWLDRPDRYAVITATVDQLGSRLLFRGYGTGEHIRPVDAALAGADSLIVIDEAHLAGPFVRTVRDAMAIEGARWHRPPVLITMSATSALEPGAWVCSTGPQDERDERAGQRLRAARQMHLVTVSAKDDDAAAPVALTAWARAMQGDGGGDGRVVAVVCNTVGDARAVFGLLRGEEADAVLLTGRIRPVDREYLLRRGWYPRVRAGRERGHGRPLYVVATQTIEVGADLDADALVTQSAPLDALTQRLGRLNRRGELADATAVVVHDPADDPVYGAPRQATWQWLTGLAAPLTPRAGTGAEVSSLGQGLDASPLALRALAAQADPEQAAAMRAAQPYVPVLFPAVLDAWCQTSPAPHPDPPVAPYLHGIDNGQPDVAVIWRADLDQSNPQGWERLVTAVAPAAEEAIEVPADAVRRWLERSAAEAAAIGDTEGITSAEETAADSNGEQRLRGQRVLRVLPDGSMRLIRPGDIRPGATIIVPATLGGCDEYGWNPASADPVIDVADLAHRRGHPVLRLTDGLGTVLAAYHSELAAPMSGLLARAAADKAEGEAPSASAYQAVIARILDGIEPGAEPPPLLRNLIALRDGCTAVLYPEPGENGEPAGVLLAARGGGQAGDLGPLDSSALGSGRIGLAGHQRAVSRRAREFASNLGLDERLAEATAMAGLLHDEGKRDPRFQAMLYGRPVRALGGAAPLLAKSGMDPADRAAFRRARLLSGYPAGMRHEALSAQVALARLADADRVDPELVVHLVAAHHGRARPLLPPVADPEPRLLTEGGLRLSTDATVDWDGPARFARLCERYGRWGLALLETIVRLADIKCSESGEHDEEEP